MPGPLNHFRGSLAAAAVFLVLAGTIGFGALAQEGGSKMLQEARKRFREGQVGTRIVGGDPTTIADNPWQVGLLHAYDKDDYLRAQFCGGVLVAPKWILTAAHCVDNSTQESEVEILSGTHKLTKGKGVRTAVQKIFVHEDWNKRPHDSDIALIKMKDALQGRAIAPARDSAALVAGAMIWISGWGASNKDGTNRMTVLQGVWVQLIPQGTQDLECNEALSYDGAVTENMFCAAKPGPLGGGGKDSCQGDSGGPASVGDAGSERLVGLVSWGDGCGMSYKYGVYTRVPNFLNWVRATSGGEVSW